MTQIRIAAFEDAAAATAAREALASDPSTVETRAVFERPERPDLTPARRRRRPFVRARGRRAMLFGALGGALLSGLLLLTYLASDLDLGVGAAAIAMATYGVVGGGLIGWFTGTERIHRRYRRLARLAPEARAFVAARVKGGVQRLRFDQICRRRGAVATIGA